MPKASKAAPVPSSQHRPAPYPTSANNAPLTASTNDQRAPASAWNESDDNQLIEARKQGLAWQPIAKTYFPSKTANACRKRHERLIDRQKVEQLDGIKEEDLARAYMEVREEMWKILASKVKDCKWKDVEEKCMEKGLKNLLSAGRNAQRRSKPDASGGDSDSEHGEPHNDSGIGGMDAEPPDENRHSDPRSSMQPQGHPHSSSSSSHHHHNSSGADYNASGNKPSNCPCYPVQSSTLSIASILQSVPVPVPSF
ncbi:myb family transcription factor [Lasallia pustulata]|uniref:Myb family transcription factor n=1 Tax=Lasallia pustulata TaxID=136370 RepID=A0A1W5CU58_9LECA|nr:myb family transcription factor [Lasallia pustulata]